MKKIIVFSILIVAASFLLLSKKESDVHEAFPSFGNYSPKVPPLSDWKNSEIRDENSLIAYTVTRPSGQFVKFNSSKDGNQLGAYNNLLIEVGQIPETYPTSIDELLEHLKKNGESIEIKLGTFKELPSVYVYEANSGYDDALYIYSYFGERMIVLTLDYSSTCYNIPENLASYSEYPIVDPENCRDYYRTYTPIVEVVLNSIKLLDENGKIITSEESVNLYE